MRLSYFNNKYFLSLSVVLFVFIIFLTLSKDASAPEVATNNSIRISEINYVEIGGSKIKVEVADSSSERMQGLSGRDSIKEDEGMLFVFPYADIYPFWMKDMKFPIDIIWLDQDMKIVYIKSDAEPKSFPESFMPTDNSLYVLEVFASFSENNNLKVGDQAQFLSS